MKKLLFMASTVMLTLSCSSSDDSSANNSNNNSSSKITPPAWIQGTWAREDLANMGYTFYKDDLCNFIGGSQYCQKEYVNLYQGTGVVTNVVQSISDTDYKCTVTISMQTSTYHFQKVNSTTIRVLQEPGSVNANLILKKQ